MASNESYSYWSEYTKVFNHVAQQNESRLKQAVWNETVNSEYTFHNYLGTIDSTTVSGRAQSTTENTIAHTRRRLGVSEYVITRYYDRIEALKMIADPCDPYIEAQVRQMNRDIDDVIIAAATGTAYTGKSGGTSTSYDSNMTITTSGGLTLAKIKSAKNLLDEAEVDDMDRYLVISSDQELELIDNSTIASIDYMNSKSIPDGKLPNILGFNIIRSERLGTSGGRRQCLYFHKNGLLFGEGKDHLGPTTIRSFREDLNHTAQVQTYYHIGAARVAENHVGVILCTES